MRLGLLLPVRLRIWLWGEQKTADRHLDECGDPFCPCWASDAVYPESFLLDRAAIRRWRAERRRQELLPLCLYCGVKYDDRSDPRELDCPEKAGVHEGF